MGTVGITIKITITTKIKVDFSGVHLTTKTNRKKRRR